MDLSQTKLSKGEWESIEVPVSQDELAILKMICKGYHNVTIKHNTNLSLIGYLKIQHSESMEDFLIKDIFRQLLRNTTKYIVITMRLLLQVKKQFVRLIKFELRISKVKVVIF